MVYAPYCIDGEEMRSCSKCHLKETRVIKADPNNHLWRYTFGCPPGCGKPAYGARVCEVCAKREKFDYDALPHNYNEEGVCIWCDPPITVDITEYEKEVVRLINIERVKYGLDPLIYDSDLCRIARKKSKDMRENNYFDHFSPTYGDPAKMLKDEGYWFSYCGENIAYGQKTPAEVVDAWMNSPPHRANILNKNFVFIGVGLDSVYINYWTQLFFTD